MFDDEWQAPGNIKCLSGSIEQMAALATLYFQAWALYAVCRFVYFLLKILTSGRAFMSESSSILVLSQLRFWNGDSKKEMPLMSCLSNAHFQLK
jgi:hypothetical protein